MSSVPDTAAPGSASGAATSPAPGLIPATILTGFLGSGKTTLLKRVLTEAHGQKIAVIENEFGEENIDNDILVSETQEQIIQLSNGCVRLQDYRRFATWVFGRVPQPSTPYEQTFQLPRPVPVYLTYLTVEPSSNGVVFRPDPYGWDALAMPQMFGSTA